jgi:hypothetical protein
MSWVLALGVAMGGLGCAGSRVDFVSYKDPYFPERFPVAFDDVRYWTTPDGAVEVIARKSGKRTAEDPAYYLHVRVFWKPVPGRTFADSTGTDAMLRYVVTRGQERQTYTGTGFVFMKKQLDGRLEIQIESARLRFQASPGGAEDSLGDMRISGAVYAAKDPGGGANLARESQLQSTQ